MKNPQWFDTLKNVLEKCTIESPLHIFGYGNNLRRDDGVELYIVSRLLKNIKELPEYIHIHPVSANIEKELKKISKSGTIIIIDAVKMDEAQGTIIFTKFKDVECYFFEYSQYIVKVHS